MLLALRGESALALALRQRRSCVLQPCLDANVHEHMPSAAQRSAAMDLMRKGKLWLKDSILC